jgi:ribosomal 30S subunit maturation factor RimM
VNATPPADFVWVARLGRTFRVRGEMRAYCASPDHLAALERAAVHRTPLWLEGVGAIRARSFTTIAGDGVIAFEGIHDPETARRHVNRGLYLPSSELPVGSDRSPAWLVGATVKLGDAPFGRVTRVDLTPQVLLHVATDHATHLLPYAAPYVRVSGDTVVIDDPPPGLLGEGA